MPNIDQTKCNHEWIVFVGAFTDSHNEHPAKFRCKKCKLIIHASDAMQWNMLKHVTGFRKWIAVVALIISVLSLAIAIISFFN